MAMCEICDQRTSSDFLDNGFSLFKIGKYTEGLVSLSQYENLRSQCLSIPSSCDLEEAVTAETTRAAIYHKLGHRKLSVESYKASILKQKKLLRYTFNAKNV